MPSITTNHAIAYTNKAYFNWVWLTKAILSFFSVSRRRTDPNFWHFQEKKSNDIVKPFFSWNNSFNLKNEHTNSKENNRNKIMNISYSILCILLIQIYEC